MPCGWHLCNIMNWHQQNIVADLAANPVKWEAAEKLPTPKKTAQERTQFGTKGKNSPAIFTDYKEMIIVGKKYEKYWCMGCKNWLLGGKVNSGHGKVSHSMEIV